MLKGVTASLNIVEKKSAIFRARYHNGNVKTGKD